MRHGDRITRSYYDKAIDKREALNAILSIGDFEAFLEESGYQGG